MVWCGSVWYESGVWCGMGVESGVWCGMGMWHDGGVWYGVALYGVGGLVTDVGLLLGILGVGGWCGRVVFVEHLCLNTPQWLTSCMPHAWPQLARARCQI